MYDFNYHRPGTLREAVELLRGSADGALLAGGMTYLPTLKLRLANPNDIVDLAGIPDLVGIRDEGEHLIIGALTTHAAVARSNEVKEIIPALATLAGSIGDAQVRNRGTLGGSIANADPAADYPAALVGLGANVVTDRRSIAADDFFIDILEVALEPDEIVTHVEFPIPDTAGYAKFPNPASRYAIAGVLVSRKGDAVRVAVTGAGPSVFRVPEMEQALAKDFTPAAIQGIHVPTDNLTDDLHGSAAYRAHLVTIMATRAIGVAPR